MNLTRVVQIGSQSGLPLGTNSSFLRAAVMGRVAPSTAFGLWTGSRSVAPVDGLLVIGGYDQAIGLSVVRARFKSPSLKSLMRASLSSPIPRKL